MATTIFERASCICGLVEIKLMLSYFRSLHFAARLSRFYSSIASFESNCAIRQKSMLVRPRDGTLLSVKFSRLLTASEEPPRSRNDMLVISRFP